MVESASERTTETVEAEKKWAPKCFQFSSPDLTVQKYEINASIFKN